MLPIAVSFEKGPVNGIGRTVDPSFLIAARAAAGTVRDAWDLAAARTVAMLVVLRTEAEMVAEREKIAGSAMRDESEKGDFMVVVCTRGNALQE